MPTYLSKTNRDRISSNGVKEYPLPFDVDTIVRIKQLPMARMQRHAEAQQAGGSRAKKDMYLLISESVVDENDERVWEPHEVPEIEQANCRLVTAIVRMISDCNGGDDDDVEAMLGNLETTE